MNILLLKKPGDHETCAALKAAVVFLRHRFPNQLNFIVEQETKEVDMMNLYSFSSSSTDQQQLECQRVVDLIVTFGGDGTILHASSLFPYQVPPILSFSLGSLGFLLPFSFKDFRSVLESIFTRPFAILNRMRLSTSLRNEDDGKIQSSPIQVMNCASGTKCPIGSYRLFYRGYLFD